MPRRTASWSAASLANLMVTRDLRVGVGYVCLQVALTAQFVTPTRAFTPPACLVVKCAAAHAGMVRAASVGASVG